MGAVSSNIDQCIYLKTEGPCFENDLLKSDGDDGHFSEEDMDSSGDDVDLERLVEDQDATELDNLNNTTKEKNEDETKTLK